MIAATLLLSLQSETTHLYHGFLDTQGPDKLHFRFELKEASNGSWTAFLLNGEERIEVPKVVFDGRDLLLDMPHYDSRIRAQLGRGRLTGVWEKRRGEGDPVLVPFEAKTVLGCAASSGSVRDISGRLAGRWAVDFETDDGLAIAELVELPDRQLRGTFLTDTGDYRYLSGSHYDGKLTLSCFDGAHAFLFSASLAEDGSLVGDFWSGNWHHESWTAKRDDAVRLADSFTQTKWNGSTKLADLAFPDLDGKKHSLAEFAGQATLLVVFGSWCPNCNDEAVLLKELDAKYRARGLRILPLAFELTGEPARDAEQVRIFQKRHGLELPFFLCGTADKAEATKALGLVDRIRAFPTTIFVGADGLPKAIHSGFAGPATGEEHAKLRRDFEARLEALLGSR